MASWDSVISSTRHLQSSHCILPSSCLTPNGDNLPHSLHVSIVSSHNSSHNLLDSLHTSQTDSSRIGVNDAMVKDVGLGRQGKVRQEA